MAEMKDRMGEKGRLSPSDTTSFEKRRSTLSLRIALWIEKQALLMPGAIGLRHSISTSTSTPHTFGDSAEDDVEDEDEDEDEDTPPYAGNQRVLPPGANAEEIDLFLPSNETCMRLGISTRSLLDKERRLRIGRIESHLTELRRLLRVKAGVAVDKRLNSVGQKGGTRSNTVLTEYRKKIDRCAIYYNEERRICLRLDPTGPWQLRLRDLAKNDIRPVHANFDEQSIPSQHVRGGNKVLSEAQRTISWIWKVPAAATSMGSETTSSHEGTLSQVPEEEETDRGNVNFYVYTYQFLMICQLYKWNGLRLGHE